LLQRIIEYKPKKEELNTRNNAFGITSKMISVYIKAFNIALKIISVTHPEKSWGDNFFQDGSVFQSAAFGGRCFLHPLTTPSLNSVRNIFVTL